MAGKAISFPIIQRRSKRTQEKGRTEKTVFPLFRYNSRSNGIVVVTVMVVVVVGGGEVTIIVVIVLVITSNMAVMVAIIELVRLTI